MQKMTHTLFAAMLVIAALAVNAGAAVVTLAPGDEITNGTIEGTGNFNPKADDVEGWLNLDFDLTSCYKDESDGEEGNLAGSYSTDIDFNSDPSGGTISWDGGDKVDGIAYLIVKNGNHAPYWYVFDISVPGEWDGMMDIELSGFWPQGGAISHVEIVCGPSHEIPTPAALPAGLALLGLAAMRRRRNG